MQKIVFFCKIICTEQVKITCDFQNPMLSILKIVLVGVYEWLSR